MSVGIASMMLRIIDTQIISQSPQRVRKKAAA
jgi:hypothetical protein